MTISKDDHITDAHVGSRIRMGRKLRDMTMVDLSSAIGTTYQQLHKYEHGINRVSASRLVAIAHILNLPISYFFEGLAGAPLSIDETTAELIGIFSRVPARRRKEMLSMIGGLINGATRA